jgi:hypothetical protein
MFQLPAPIVSLARKVEPRGEMLPPKIKAQYRSSGHLSNLNTV